MSHVLYILCLLTQETTGAISKISLASSNVFPTSHQFTSYAIFMDNLTDIEKDMNILCKVETTDK